MKRIGAFSLAIFIFVLSVFSVIPVDVYADDDKTVLSFTFKQLNHSVGAGMSASDANAVVTAHKDIYTSDGKLLFIYNPSNSYNWTTSTAVYYVTLNYSDEQLKNILMSKNPLMTLFSVSQALANNNGIRAFCAGLGTIFSGNSDMGTKVLDTITGNYNYLDSLNYDEDSQTITMSNDNGSVDKLRKEIKDYYLDSIGAGYMANSYELNSNKPLPAKAIENIHSSYEYEDDYISDFNAANQYDYTISASSNNVVLGFDKSFSYAYLDESLKYNGWSTSFGLYFVNENLEIVKPDFHLFNPKSLDIDMNNIKLVGGQGLGTTGGTLKYFDIELYNSDNSKICGIHYWQGYSYFFTNKNVNNTLIFKSYSALYNYVHGDQNAYLSSQINKIGEDITFSIKDMNENIGSKMDTLIDSINDKKGSMSADDLQNAIDKGIEDLNKNTEDIKDNTSSILDKLEEQNQILLQILGVTEFIAYQEVKENSDQYNMSYLKTLLDSMFTGLFNALMYGENTVDDKNTDTASMQSFSVSNAAAPAAVYSDDIAVYGSSGSGGGSSFGGGSGSSSGHFFDLKNGLFGKFPFSIPYQCYNWLQILQRDPEAPTFTLDYGYLFGAAGAPEYVLTFDLSRYNDIAEVGRSFCRLFMTLMLALGIYHKNKGEM